jgi:hypothetical protein
MAANVLKDYTGGASENTSTNKIFNSGDASSFPVPVPGDSSAKFVESIIIGALPNEVLSYIFGYLDTPAPSISTLREEPVFELTNAEVANLKTVSLVSKRWRGAILPLLFKHSRFIITEPTASRLPLLEAIRPFLDFFRDNSLNKATTSLVLLVGDKKVGNRSDYNRRSDCFEAFWETIFKTIDPTELLIVAHPEALGALTSCSVFLSDAWCFDSPYHYLRLQRSPLLNLISIEETGGVDEALKPGQIRRDGQSEIQPESSSLDSNLNNTQDPLSRPIDINPRILRVSSQAAKSSSISCVSLDREITPVKSSALFHIRPWSSLLLNEGSFIKAYSTYEFWLRQPPSVSRICEFKDGALTVLQILPDLVGESEMDESPQQALISRTIRDFSYIGIFPMVSHFSALTKNLPRLDNLYVQLVPKNNILNNPKKMTQVEAGDLWLERNSCYAILMRELFNAPPLMNFKYLQVFESGDAADEEAVRSNPILNYYFIIGQLRAALPFLEFTVLIR